MSQDVLKHPNLHDRGKQATCRIFLGLPRSTAVLCFNFFDSVERPLLYQLQTGGLMFKKKKAKEFIQIAMYFVFLPLRSFFIFL